MLYVQSSNSHNGRWSSESFSYCAPIMSRFGSDHVPFWPRSCPVWAPIMSRLGPDHVTIIIVISTIINESISTIIRYRYIYIYIYIYMYTIHIYIYIYIFIYTYRASGGAPRVQRRGAPGARQGGHGGGPH